MPSHEADNVRDVQSVRSTGSAREASPLGFQALGKASERAMRDSGGIYEVPDTEDSVQFSSLLALNPTMLDEAAPGGTDPLDVDRAPEEGTDADPAARYRSTTKVPLEGYDQRKLDDPNHKTPKYLFGRIAQKYNLDSVKGDKAKAEELLKAMLPELKAAGLEIVAVKGDRIQVKTEVGYEWVDVIRGAGGDDPGWWWGSEGKGTAQPTNSPQEWAAQTGQAGAAGAAGGGAAPAGNFGPKILGGQIDQGKVMAILQKHKADNEGIKAALPELQQAFPGVTILDHPQRLDKLRFSNGAVVDVVVGAGGPNPSWGWMPEN